LLSRKQMGSAFILMAAFFGAIPSSVTVPLTLPAVDESTFMPDGVADGDEGSFDVFEVVLSPPPHAATEAASVTAPKTASRRGPLFQTFRECIDFS
jgi:hypothetical protein